MTERAIAQHHLPVEVDQGLEPEPLVMSRLRAQLEGLDARREALDQQLESGLDESLLRNLGKEGDSVRFVARPKQIVTLRFAL